MDGEEEIANLQSSRGGLFPRYGRSLHRVCSLSRRPGALERTRVHAGEREESVVISVEANNGVVIPPKKEPTGQKGCHCEEPKVTKQSQAENEIASLRSQ